MTLEQKQRQYDEAAAQLREAQAENQRIEDGLRASEARRVAGLREAEKIELEEASKVFEALGMSKNAAMLAAQGRAA